VSGLFRGRRKLPPRHVLEPSPSGPAAPRRRRDNTTLVLIVVLVLTSSFVVGTTATFTASTRNTGTFTVGGIATPTAPVVSMDGTTANFSWTAVSGAANNANVGYRVSRKGVGGPTTTAGSGSAPNCASGSYTTLGYTTGVTNPDATIPSAAADQGEYYCYAAEGVFPCCPATGKQPVITSLQGKIQVAVQTGYVVSSWSFNTGNNSQILDSGEKLVMNFNQDVATSTSITTAETVCIDPYNSRILVGVTATTADSCQWEVQTLTATGTGGNWRANAGNASANIAYNATAATVKTAIQNLTNIGGASNLVVTGPTLAGSTRTWTVYFSGTKSGDQPQITTTDQNLSGTGHSTTQATLFGGVTETTSLGYLSNAGTWTGNPARYPISAVAWSNCTVVNVSCKTATITLGANSGSNSVTLPTGTWTMNPSPAAGKSTSTTGSLVLCMTDPIGSPIGGLCRPTAAGSW
jgi:hypothetical protein